MKKPQKHLETSWKHHLEVSRKHMENPGKPQINLGQIEHVKIICQMVNHIIIGQIKCQMVLFFLSKNNLLNRIPE